MGNWLAKRSVRALYLWLQNTVLLWTHEQCRALIAEHYAWFLPVYDGYELMIKRVDAEIYFLMLHFGGVYVDLDCEALRPLDPLLKNRQLVIAPEPPGNLKGEAKAAGFKQMFANAVVASVPGHPFWAHVIDLMQVWKDAAEPMDAAGPFLLTRAYESFDAPETMTLEAYQHLLPIAVDETWAVLPAATRAMIRRDAYVIHHWYGSWLMDPLVSKKAVVVQILHDGQPQAAPQETTRERLLPAQLAVHCFQKQSYAQRELIIIDDGPDEGLEAWLGEHGDPLLFANIVNGAVIYNGVHIYNEPNGGITPQVTEVMALACAVVENGDEGPGNPDGNVGTVNGNGSFYFYLTDGASRNAAAAEDVVLNWSLVEPINRSSPPELTTAVPAAVTLSDFIVEEPVDGVKTAAAAGAAAALGAVSLKALRQDAVDEAD